MVGFIFGWVAYAGGFHWMWRIVDVFLGGNIILGAVLWLADSAWFAGRFALYAVLYQMVRRRGWPVALAALPPLLVIEWLHPAIFPVYLGHSLAERPYLIQISDLGGPLLMTALLAVLNAAMFEAWRWWRGRANAAAWTGTIAVVVLVFAELRCGADSPDRPRAAAPALRVGVVQGNLGVFEKSTTRASHHRRYLEQTRELLAGGAVDLVVWPETVYTRGLMRPLPLSGHRSVTT